MKITRGYQRVLGYGKVRNHLNRNKEKRKRPEGDEMYLTWKAVIDEVKKRKREEKES